MRIDEPKRPGEDAGKNAEQVYKWMYRVTEQLNMMMEQLERNNVLDLMATGIGTTAQNGLIGGSVEDNSEDLALIKAEQENIKTRMGELNTAVDKATTAIELQLGGKTIFVGSATIAFSNKMNTVSITFPRAFSAVPNVVIQQVFDTTNIILQGYKPTATGFTAQIGGYFSSSGTRQFQWIAIGDMA